MCSSVDSRTNKVIVEKLILLTSYKFKLDFFFFLKKLDTLIIEN